MQVISTIFLDQMPTYFVSRKDILCWHQHFQNFTIYSDNPEQWQGKIESNLQKILKYTPLLLCRWICYV